METGEYVCSNPPYGYVLVNKQLEIYEAEATVVRRIYKLYLQGMGVQQIAALLNAENIPRSERKGYKTWNRNAVLYILKNERYIGDALLEKKYTTDCLPYRQKKNNGEKPQYYVENYCPPIISRETFQAVQTILDSKRKERGARRAYTLTQIMRCPDCGRAFRRQEIRGKAYWLCGQLASSAGKCKSRRIREDMAYDTFTAMIYKLKANRESLLEKLIQRLEYLQSRTSENIERIRQIDKEIADLSAKNLVVTRLHTSGVLGTAEYTMQTAEIGNKITELRIERRRKLQEDENDMLLDALKTLNETIKKYAPNGQFDEDLFEQIVEKIIVNDNSRLTFHLIGGLTLTEEIKAKGRCKTA